MFVFFFLSLIASLTAKEILQRLPRKLGYFLMVSIILILLAEYWVKPIQFADIPPQLPDVYSLLNSQDHIKVILEYPIGNDLPSDHPYSMLHELNTHYLLYASMFHDKKLLNGFGTFFPPKYKERTIFLTLNFPTRNKLKEIKSLGVDAIILHREEFRQPQDYDVVETKLVSLKLPIIYSTENLALFDLTKWAP